MNTKYLLIEAAAVVDETARPFFVYVGASKQADRDYLTILAHATSHGYYFERFSPEVAQFLFRLQSSVPDLPPVVSCTAREFVRALRGGSRPCLDAAQLANADRLRHFLDLNYRTASPRSLPPA